MIGVSIIYYLKWDTIVTTPFPGVVCHPWARICYK